MSSPGGKASGLRRRLQALDRYQRAHAWLGFPLAVRQKYADDQGGYLAAGITYYAFFSIFPLLLVLVSVLGFVLRGDHRLERSIVGSALGQFPVIGPQLHTHSLKGNGLALGLGILAALWAGTGVCQAAQNALDQLWGVPLSQRPSFLQSRARALALLLVLGLGVIAGTGLGGLGTVGSHLGLAWKLLAVAFSTLLDFGVFWVAFRTLTTSQQSWRCLRGGAATAAVAYECLQLAGGYYVGHVLKSASNTYGTFALVIGLLSWIYLATHALLLAAEANVVAARRLWPRSLSVRLGEPPTAEDEAALRQRARVEQRRPDAAVDVVFTAEESPAQRMATGDRTADGEP